MKYFVSYRCWYKTYYGTETEGWGRCEITRDEPISSIGVIRTIEQTILDTNNTLDNQEISDTYSKILIMNWQKFED